MKKLMTIVAAAMAFVLTGQAESTAWFNANINGYAVGALPLNAATGGNWVGDAASLLEKAEVLVANQVEVDATSADPLEFAATAPDTIAVSATKVLLDTTIVFTPFTTAPSGAAADGVKASVCIDDDGNVYGIKKADEGSGNVWADLGIDVTDVTAAQAVKIEAVNKDDNTITVTYTVGGTAADAVDVNVADKTITKVCYSGAGKINALSSQHDVISYSITIDDSTFAAKHIAGMVVSNATAGAVIESPYSAPYGANVVVYFTPAEGYFIRGNSFLNLGAITGNRSVTSSEIADINVLEKGAKIGSTFYISLSEAIQEANSAKGDVSIVLLKDEDSLDQANYYIQRPGLTTIDLGGHTVTYGSTLKNCFWTKLGSSLTLKNGFVKMASGVTANQMFGVYGNENDSVVIENVKFDATGLVRNPAKKKDSEEQRDLYQGVLTLTGGNVELKGTTVITNVPAGLLSFIWGNYGNTSSYTNGLLKIGADVRVDGNVMLSGGKKIEIADPANLGTPHYLIGANMASFFKLSEIKGCGFKAVGGSIPTERTATTYTMNYTGELFLSVEGALAAVAGSSWVYADTVTLLDNKEFTSLTSLAKDGITVDANGNVLSFANAAMALNNNVKIICSGDKAGKGVLNKAQITIAAGKTLDLSELSWGLGLIGDDAKSPTARFTLNVGASITMGRVESTWADSFTNIVSAVDGYKVTLAKADDVATISVEKAASPVVPGDSHTSTAETKEAAEAEVAVTVDPYAQADLVTAGVEEVTYKSYFKPVATGSAGNWTVKVEMKSEVTEAVQAVVDNKIKTADPAAAEVTISLAAADVKPGLYYGIAVAEGLNAVGAAVPEEWKMATATGVSVSANKPDAASAFYVLKCSAVDTNKKN